MWKTSGGQQSSTLGGALLHSGSHSPIGFTVVGLHAGDTRSVSRSSFPRIILMYPYLLYTCTYIRILLILAPMNIYRGR